MLYNSINLDCVKIVSKNTARPELASVFFTKEKTVATDSFRLLEVSTPANVKPEDYPKVQGMSVMFGCKPFMVSAEMLKDIKLKDKVMGVKHIHDNRVEFITTDMRSQPAVEDVKVIRRIEGTFPDYMPLFPQGEATAEVVINPKYLIELLQVLSKLSGNDGVKIKFYGKNKPLYLEAGSKEKQFGRGLLMPIMIN